MLSDVTNATFEQIVLEADDGFRGKEWREKLYTGQAQANKYRCRGLMKTGTDKLSEEALQKAFASAIPCI
jgi:hypothetical protein